VKSRRIIRGIDATTTTTTVFSTSPTITTEQRLKKERPEHHRPISVSSLFFSLFFSHDLFRVLNPDSELFPILPNKNRTSKGLREEEEEEDKHHVKV
jgi:hypothetical protein|tara:strand:+ start:278 stop:568 length:291 start_codon:yes stop_codon:yes gene_type:complete